MKIVITGATGNLGTSVLAALAADERVSEIVGLSRRVPSAAFAKARFVSADVTKDPLEPHLAGAAAVIHLAWRIQSSHDAAEIERTNVAGSERVFRALAAAGTPALLYASSVGAYSASDKFTPRDEAFPTDGIASSTYSRQKAAVERRLDAFERECPGVRVVRLRPALIFKRNAATHIQELFLGSLAPRLLFAPKGPRFVVDHPSFRFQAVHAADVAQAFLLALFGEARGAFNVAAEPVLDPDVLSNAFGARKLPISPRVLRAFAALAFRLRLSPAEPGWIDLCFQSPILDTSRVRGELRWEPAHSSVQALDELVRGLAERATFATPPLDDRPDHGKKRISPA